MCTLFYKHWTEPVVVKVVVKEMLYMNTCECSCKAISLRPLMLNENALSCLRSGAEIHKFS